MIAVKTAVESVPKRVTRNKRITDAYLFMMRCCRMSVCVLRILYLYLIVIYLYDWGHTYICIWTGCCRFSSWAAGIPGRSRGKILACGCMTDQHFLFQEHGPPYGLSDTYKWTFYSNQTEYVQWKWMPCHTSWRWSPRNATVGQTRPCTLEWPSCLSMTWWFSHGNARGTRQ